MSTFKTIAINKTEIWNLIRQFMQGFSKHYVNEMDTTAKAAGIEPMDFFIVIFSAFVFQPDPISAARLRIRVPYNSPVFLEKRFQTVKELGFIDEALEGGYILNQRGQDAFKKVIDATYKQMERIPTLPIIKMNALKLLLAKLVQGSILSPEQSCKWSILNSRRLDPGRDAAPIISIDQYISDLFAYRDDAHLLSWSSYSIGAHAWDILGAIWQYKASSIAEVIDLLRRRGWTEDETEDAIEELVSIGWFINNEKLTLTEEGKLIRDEAEEMTDKIFFSPWDVLTDLEFEKLYDLLTELNTILDEI